MVAALSREIEHSLLISRVDFSPPRHGSTVNKCLCRPVDKSAKDKTVVAGSSLSRIRRFLVFPGRLGG